MYGNFLYFILDQFLDDVANSTADFYYFHALAGNLNFDVHGILESMAQCKDLFDIPDNLW